MNIDGCDSVVIETIEFLLSDTTALFATSCNPLDTGIFVNNLMNFAGCDSLIVTTVSLMNCVTDTTLILDTTCEPSQTRNDTLTIVGSMGQDSIIIYNTILLPSDTVFVNLTSCNPLDTGLIQENLTNIFGCDSLVITQTDLLTSTEETIFLSSCNPRDTGRIVLTFQNVTGCDSTVITMTSLLPSSIETIELTTCDPVATRMVRDTFINQFGCDSILVTNITYQPPSVSKWTTTTCDPSELSSDTVFLENYLGCDSLVITEVILDQISIVLETIDPECFGEEDGQIIIDTIIGGTAPYLTALGDGPLNDQQQYFRLPPGKYQVMVQDANGCETIREVNITSPEELTLDLGLPNEINLGESLEIDPQISQPIDTFIWEVAGDSLFCDSCLIQSLQPLNSARYQLTVLTGSGCSATEVFVVNVKKERAVYVPNAFSPNQDGNNDVLMIYGGPEVARVKNISIFNRWGALVFSDENFPTDDPSHGWNGMFKGKPVNPGVFVYQFEIEFVDGYTKTYQGDVTIIK